MNGETSKQIFLLEHGKGFCCCRLQVTGYHRVMPVSDYFLYPQIELEVPTEARIRGVVDLEIRSLVNIEQPEIPKMLTGSSAAKSDYSGADLSHLLRKARAIAGLSFREASARSRRIADLLRNEQYFISPGSFSDYEAQQTAPRHFHKVITLCSVYAVPPSAFLRTLGIIPEQGGGESMPDHLVGRLLLDGVCDGGCETERCGGFMAELLAHWSGGVPLFLRRSLGTLSPLGHLSLHDFFWIGGEKNALHPYLMNGVVVIVNRRKKRPLCSTSIPPWRQPLYVILTRDGTYLCGCCKIEEGNLVLHAYSQPIHRSKRFRYPQDAEVIGQIVTVARKLAHGVGSANDRHASVGSAHSC
jgi:hypothetical protein